MKMGIKPDLPHVEDEHDEGELFLDASQYCPLLVCVQSSTSQRCLDFEEKRKNDLSIECTPFIADIIDFAVPFNTSNYPLSQNHIFDHKPLEVEVTKINLYVITIILY